MDLKFCNGSSSGWFDKDIELYLPERQLQHDRWLKLVSQFALSFKKFCSIVYHQSSVAENNITCYYRKSLVKPPNLAWNGMMEKRLFPPYMSLRPCITRDIRYRWIQLMKRFNSHELGHSSLPFVISQLLSEKTGIYW